ncbi:MAG: radical SAM protein [Spirochaetota bacterium]
MKKNVVVLFYPSPWDGEQRGRIPYALLYLERMLRDLAVEVVLIDEQVQREYRSIIEPIQDRILLAGISAMTGHQIIGGIAFSKYIKSLHDIPVVWGGWQATLLPEQVLAEAYIDMIIMGQGEIPFQKLVDGMLQGSDITQIKGLGFKKDGSIVVNPIEKFVDMNNFPRVDYRLIDINNYVYKSAYAERCIGYFTSHGCPYNCAFCCVAEVYGRRWYHKSIDTIIEDIAYFKKAAGVDSVSFDDDNFFVNKGFTIELCRTFVQSDVRVLWDTSAHAGLFLRLFSDNEVGLFHQAGCRQIYIGAESGDQAVLDRVAKDATVDDNYKFVEVLNRHHITPLFSTMICLPMDPGKDMQLTLDMIRKAKLIDRSLRSRIFFYTPYPGTELYDEAVKKGFLPPGRLEDWATHTLRKFHAPWWTRDYRWQLEIFANFYLPLVNPNYYRMAPKSVRPIAYLVNKLFGPIAYLRFKFNLLMFPIEAILFLLSLRFFNRIFHTHFCLGFESYLD